MLAYQKNSVLNMHGNFVKSHHRAHGWAVYGVITGEIKNIKL